MFIFGEKCSLLRYISCNYFQSLLFNHLPRNMANTEEDTLRATYSVPKLNNLFSTIHKEVIQSCIRTFCAVRIDIRNDIKEWRVLVAL